MCGFRTPDEIHRLLVNFLRPASSPTASAAAPAVLREGFIPLLQSLEKHEPDTALRNFFNGLFCLSQAVRDALTEYILCNDMQIQDERKLLQSFARQYPGDPAVIAPLYLNIFRLEPGEAVFLKAGILHAYIHGFGVELMANSDNVLRGGLTKKHIDIPELMKVLDFVPQKPQIITPEPNRTCFTYPVFCEEFSLAKVHNAQHSPLFSEHGPSVCIVTEGTFSIENPESSAENRLVLGQGESAFIPPAGCGESSPVLQGQGTIFIASCGIGFDENLC
jgi:mannose-6-phosphate isomerase